ncbi:hypothetical protein SAMN06265371_108116 [Lutibacter agarilyticus]|uniref:Por secretion system C-terminal sorting domain-containing protein n=1 Tax=Lutibacter agarilyticus TaxID=1109740 RepID=A0A238YA40_9FLAO|nr:DUF3244 domain-containing protein [Lutibacter agarilyticus]SNR67199.1 hypothetical protein SAMN06265371_108116 [Lutibacter agarilyticus]
MKNLIKKSLLVVAVLTTIVMSGANINNNVKVNVIDSKVIDLKLKNSDGDLTISVRDAKGETLYTEKFEGNYFSKKYDLNTLPTGDYYFEIEGRTKINLMPFKVTSEGIEFDNKVESIYYKPNVRQDGDLVFISKVALNNENFTISLYDDHLNMLYKEELSGQVNLGKTLNLMKLEKGSYSVVMKSGGKSFEQKIYKK